MMEPSQRYLSDLAELDAIERLVSEARNRIRVLPTAGRCLHAIDEYRTRRARDAVFGPLAEGLFGEPAWDILLDLSIAGTTDRPISISSACIASAVPATTALRHLGLLERHGLVTRYPDPKDQRRAFVRLTDRAEAALERWTTASGAP